jgi:hypothetical protein
MDSLKKTSTDLTRITSFHPVTSNKKGEARSFQIWPLG